MEQQREYVGIDLHRRRSVIVRRSAATTALSSIAAASTWLANTSPIVRLKAKSRRRGRATPGARKQSGITVTPSPARTIASARSSLVVRAVKKGRTPWPVK